ncbi:hypothetical protein EFS11_00360 [Levilactobacillus brevis]|nr:hypothetical protein [Levilactobacillus brevis]
MLVIKMTQITNWPTNVLRGLFSHNITIFFGAGVAKEFGFPLWNEFIDTLKNEVSLPDNKKGIADEYYKEDQKMEFIQTYFDANLEETMNLIMHEFKRDIPHEDLANSNEALLLQLNAGSYITTNIDNSLDVVKGLAGKMRAQIFWYNQDNDIKDKVISKDYAKDPLIIRLHGSLNDTKNLIFSRDQYTKISSSNSFVMKKLLPALFITTTVLFVGYSINDPDVLRVITDSYSPENIQHNFFILTNEQDKLLPEQEKYGVKAITMNYPDIHDQTEILKRALTELVKIRNHFDTPEGYTFANDIINSGEKSRMASLNDIINRKSQR